MLSNCTQPPFPVTQPNTTATSTAGDSDDTLRKVYVEPTSACNLNCRTCIRNVWDEPQGLMEWEIFQALLKGLKDFPTAETVAFAGFGEPLLHPRFADMIHLAHTQGLRTEVTTNALLLTPELVGRLLSAGLNQLVVSIDGASAEGFGDIRAGASLRQVIENVRLFWKLNKNHATPPVTIGIEFVAMKRNIHELPELHHVAKQIGATFILVSNVLPYTSELQGEVLYNIRATSYTGQGSPYSPNWILPKMDINKTTQEPLTRVFRTQANISLLDYDVGARSNYCPFINAGALALSQDGTISPCPPLMHTYHCFVMGRPKVIRRYEVGNLREATLKDIWEKPDYLAFRRRVREFDFPPCTDCGCDLAEKNEEDCFGNPFPVCGDCLWARGVIRCA